VSEHKELRQPDFPGLRLVPDESGGARIAQNCDLFNMGQLDSRAGYRHANHRRYNGGVVAIIDVQRICDYGKILVCSGWTPDPFTEIFDHTEPVDPGWGGPVGRGGYGGNRFWDKGFPPVAVAAGLPLEGIPPLLVQFAGVGSFDPDGGPITYSWNFGDGSPLDNTANPQHTFVGNAVRTVSLTVTDSEGKTDTAQLTVDTSETVVVAGGNVRYSHDGGVTWAASAGIPAGNTNWVLTLGEFIFAFRSNAAANQVDIYRSVDNGVNFALVGNIPSNAGAVLQPVVGANGRIIVPTTQMVTLDTAVGYSDDNGVTWNVSVVSLTNSLGQLLHMGGGVIACILQAGAGVAFETHISNDNGATWGADNGGFGDSVQVPRIGLLQGNRLVVAIGTPVPGSQYETRTSDDFGVTWQLRDGPQPAFQTYYAMGADGLEAILSPWAPAGIQRQSLDRGVTWANGFNFGGVVYAFKKRSDGWFAGVAGNVWFSAALPNFVLRGASGLGIIQSIAVRPE
jgi:hypothetical protein